MFGNPSKWTKALWEPNAGVDTSKECVTLGDTHIDYHLILVDESDVPCRLRLYKGLTPAVESVLSDSPVGIVSFTSDPGQTESPCLAVAFSAYLLVYRNMKPYYRFNITQMDILPAERDIWNRFKEGKLEHSELLNALQHLRGQHSLQRMSFQSQQILTLTDTRYVTQLLEQVRVEKKEYTELKNVQIACLAKMPRHSSAVSVDVLVVGTELGSFYFIDSQAYTVLHHTFVGVAPIKMLPIGTYDVEFRLVICTREPEVYTLRRNSKGLFSVHSFYVRDYPFDVVSCRNQLVFATKRRRLVYFTVKGRQQNALQFQEDITDIEQFHYELRHYNGVLVAIGQEIHLYVDQFCVNTLRFDLPVEWMRFGKMGGEEGVLVIATQGGGLCIKIFRRVAALDEARSNPKTLANKSIEIPKKSKLFVEQSLREQENPLKIHQIYQRDWFMIRYHTAKTFVDLESGKTELVPTHESEPFQLSYDLLGFGPYFRLVVRLITSNKLKPCRRWLCFIYNGDEYHFKHHIIDVPPLPANQWFTFANEIICRNPEKQLQEEVKIVFAREKMVRPIWATTFEMPLSEPTIV